MPSVVRAFNLNPMQSMPETIKIHNLRMTSGAHAGLGEPTASCRWQWVGGLLDTTLTPQQISLLRERVDVLVAGESLFGVNSEAWPQAFLANRVQAHELVAWAVALTVMLQRMAGDAVWQGRIAGYDEAGVRVALPWQRETVFKKAMPLALRLLMTWLAVPALEAQATALQSEIDGWLAKAKPSGLSPNALRFALAAHARGMPVSVDLQLLTVGWGSHAQRLDSSFTWRTSQIAARLARDKHLASHLLARGQIPIAASQLCATNEQALAAAEKMGWPVVVKPRDLDQGLGVVTGIRDAEALQKAFDAAAKLSQRGVIVQRHIEGHDHRLLVLDGRMLMATQRIPGGVTGDGEKTVAQLMALTNQDPRRGDEKRSLLIRLTLDDEAQTCLSTAGLTAESVPAAGRFVCLRGTANISTGGTAIDVTDVLHPDNRLLAERAAQLIGVDLAGIDFLCPDISRSWREVGGVVIEVNSQPGFRPHWLGAPQRDINGEILDWLFRKTPARIPTVAITGSEGAGAVAAQLHRLWLATGRHVGLSSSQGVWAGEAQIAGSDLAGLRGTRLLLQEPSVQAAVLEIPAHHLARQGQPCDRYDVVAVLNVAQGEEGTMQQRAQRKSEVLSRARRAVVLNATDPWCLAMRKVVKAPRQILVGADPRTPVLQEHLQQGGPAVFLQSHQGAEWIVLAEGATQTWLMPLPAVETLHVLFAVASAWALGISHDLIKNAAP